MIISLCIIKLKVAVLLLVLIEGTETGIFFDTCLGFHGSNSDKYCIPHRNKNSINESSDDSGTDDGTDDSETDKNKPTVNQESNGDDEDNPKTIIIIVCVLLVLLLTGVIVFIRCRYKNR